MGGHQASHSLCGQVGKGKKGTKPQSNMMCPKGPIDYGLVHGKETRWSYSHRSNLNKKEEIPREQSTKSANMKDGNCFICHQEGHMAHE